MRFKLFLICLGVVVLSLASGLGLRFALAAWQEPTEVPPGGNVSAPINVGATNQAKEGGLQIGGAFTVVGSGPGKGAVIGAPTGGNMGGGSLNAEQLCIQGFCLSSWVMGDAFVQNGNSFGVLAVLGTNDGFGLALETAGSERMRIDTAGNVGIGTTGPGVKLDVVGNIKIPGSNYLLTGTYDSRVWSPGQRIGGMDYMGDYGLGMSYLAYYDGGWKGNAGGTAAYLGVSEGQLSFANAPSAGAGSPLTWTDRFVIANTGNVGVGTASPLYNLVVRGASPRTYIWSTSGNPELDLGDGTNHWAIYRDTATDQLRFWKGDNNLTITSDGDVNSKRCFGPVYVGQTAATYNGARGGYTSANALCAASIAGSHVCATGEILETIKCNQPSLPTTDQAWITNGPPGYTARANDCTGWTSTSPSGSTTVYGAIWAFDASGGVGWVTTCNQSLKFACCK